LQSNNIPSHQCQSNEYTLQRTAKDCNNANILKYKTHKTNDISTTAAVTDNIFKSDSYLRIEDPINLHDNPARMIRKESWRRVRREFLRAYVILNEYVRYDTAPKDSTHNVLYRLCLPLLPNPLDEILWGLFF